MLGLQPAWAKDSFWDQFSGILFLSCVATINTIITISIITLAIYYCYLTYNDNLHYCMRASFYSKQPHWIRKIYWQWAAHLNWLPLPSNGSAGPAGTWSEGLPAEDTSNFLSCVFPHFTYPVNGFSPGSQGTGRRPPEPAAVAQM